MGVQSAIRPSAISGAIAAATWALESRANALVSVRWGERATQSVPPHVLDGVEVVVVGVSEEGDELDTAPSVHDLANRCVDGVAECGGAQDCSGLCCDISINFDGCLTHV